MVKDYQVFPSNKNNLEVYTWSIEGTLTDTATLGQSHLVIKVNEGLVLVWFVWLVWFGFIAYQPFLFFTTKPSL